MKFKFSLKTV